MHYINRVHRIQAPDCLNEYFPDLPLFNVSPVLLVPQNFLEDVSVLAELRDNAEGVGGVVPECLPVLDNVRMLNGR